MVDVAGQAVVAILTRAPSAGGKSRLFAALGRPPDPDLLGALLLDTLDGIAAAAAARVVCFTPDDAAPEMRALAPPEVQLLPQGDGDLGARMSRAFERLFAGGASPIVLVGSDLPLIDAAAVGDAFARLRADPGAVVLGPAADGGYYLVGATRLHPALFDGIVASAPAFDVPRAAIAEAWDTQTFAQLARRMGLVDESDQPQLNRTFTDDELANLFRRSRESLSVVAGMWPKLNLAAPDVLDLLERIVEALG